MKGKVYIYRQGEWVERERPVIENHSPYVIPDTMDDTWHPCTGEHLSSKSGFREITKANGCIEYGTEDPRKHIKKKPISSGLHESVLRAYDECESGNARPVDEMTRAEFDRYGTK